MVDENTTMVEQNRRYGQMIARAWTEPEFKARLLAEPTVVAQEAGLDVPEGMRLRAIDVAPEETYVVLAPPEKARDAAGAAQDADEDAAQFLALLERAASDPAFKARLTSEPVAALAEQGFVLPETSRVVVVEPSDTEGYLFVPPIPDDLDIDNLDTVGFVGPSNPPSPACTGKGSSSSLFQGLSQQRTYPAARNPVLATNTFYLGLPLFR